MKSNHFTRTKKLNHESHDYSPFNSSYKGHLCVSMNVDLSEESKYPSLNYNFKFDYYKEGKSIIFLKN